MSILARRFPVVVILILIVFAIVTPIISLTQGGGVDGRVYFVVPRSFARMLEAQGYSLGSIMIAMISPLDYEGYSYWLRDVIGKMVELDFRRVAESWVKFYDSDIGRRVRNSSLRLPTISITMTLNREGEECVAHYTYSTIDYFIESEGLDVVKAIEKAREDPLAHLRKPLTVILKKKMPKGDVSVACTDLTERLERLKEVTDRIVENMSGTYGKTVEVGKDLANKEVTLSTSCPEFTRVWWSALYNSRDAPPVAWYNNIYHPNNIPIPGEEKLGVWRFYADRYSRAYYWPTSSYNVETAKQATLAMLGVVWESLYSMDGWIHRMFQYLYGRSGVQWKDYYENYGYSDIVWAGYAPYVGIQISNPNNKPIIAGVSLGVAIQQYYKHGFSVAGIIFIGKETSTLVPNTHYVADYRHMSKAYVVAWTRYSYVQDGLLLYLDVSRVTEGTCTYWRVIPVTTIMPIYDFLVDWRYMDTVYGRDPDFYRELLYSSSVDTVYYKSLYKVPKDTKLYEESSSDIALRVSNPSLASLTANLLTKAIDLVLKNLACQGNIACTFFLNVMGDLVNYVYKDLQAIGVSFYFSLVTRGYIDYAVFQVDKITLRASNAYNSIGWRPLMIEYRVYIDSSPSPPPCDTPYCPYAREGGYS